MGIVRDKVLKEMLGEKGFARPLDKYEFLNWPFDTNHFFGFEELDDIFVNREKEIKDLIHLIRERISRKDKKHIAVVGPNRTGKSLLLAYTFHMIKLVLEKKVVTQKDIFKDCGFYIFPFDDLTKENEKKELDDFINEQIKEGNKVFVFLHSPSMFDEDHIEIFLSYIKANVGNLYVIFPFTLIVWQNLEFYFKQDIKDYFDDIIWVYPFTSKQISELLIKRMEFFRKNKNSEKTFPFTSKALNYISELSEGSPLIALDIAQTVLMSCAEKMVDKISEKNVMEFTQDYQKMKNNFINLTDTQILTFELVYKYSLFTSRGIKPVLLAKERKITPSAAVQILKTLENKKLIFQRDGKYLAYYFPAFLLEARMLEDIKKVETKIKMPKWIAKTRL
jgi:Cdc6-like AAA superfamily ATPase